MAEAKAKKDQIIARARTAKAATKVNDMLSGIGDGSSMAAFDKMAAKVDKLEAEAEVSKQLAASSSSGIGSGSSLDAQFKALERGGVDDELEKMKRNILPQVRRPRPIAARPLEPPAAVAPAAVAHLLRTFASQRFHSPR
mmetsp:Transcript_23349/g.74781  ORF Transcript_23349/g.74781 Transcript_23349/m.74781 type:complete len:140 (+) Transcript_23349:184-603(+)